MSLTPLEQLVITLPRLDLASRRDALWRYKKSELLALGREYRLSDRYLASVEQLKGSYSISDREEVINALLVAIDGQAQQGVQEVLFE